MKILRSIRRVSYKIWQNRIFWEAEQLVTDERDSLPTVRFLEYGVLNLYEI